MSPPGELRECEQSGQAAAYVLGALEREEGERYSVHLTGCLICAAEVASLQPIVDTLPASAPLAKAPDVLRERVMVSVRSEAKLLQASGADADRLAPVRRPWHSRRLALLTAATAMGVGVLIGAVAIDTGSPAPAVHVTTAQLASLPAGAGALVRESGAHGELVVSGVPQPPRGKIYEIWLARADGTPQPTNALFGITRAGNASVDVPGDLTGVKQVLVTAEPLGGSSHPTSSPIIVATLRSARA
jgi:anti-sigma-K factor RskA